MFCCLTCFSLWQFGIKATIGTDLGEEQVATLDGESTFDEFCKQLDTTIEKWKEFYVIVDKDTNTTITTSTIFDGIIEAAKNSGKRNATILCQPKYVFDVTDETDSKENNFLVTYFPSSMTTYKTFLEKITKNLPKWDENYEVVHITTAKVVIDDDVSFNTMIDSLKYGQDSNIFICLRTKVCHCLFSVFVLEIS